MTLPRELKLSEYDGKPLLTCAVVNEIDKIAGTWQNVDATIDAKDAYQLRLTLNLDKNSIITLSNDIDEKFVVDVNAAARSIIAHRTSASGATSFNGTFSIPSMQAPLKVSGNTVTLDFFVDQSSVELLTAEGTMSMTNLVFPQSIYNRITVTGAECKVQARVLTSIWK